MASDDFLLTLGDTNISVFALSLIAGNNNCYEIILYIHVQFQSFGSLQQYCLKHSLENLCQVLWETKANLDRTFAVLILSKFNLILS